jgi:hypothetical protein
MVKSFQIILLMTNLSMIYTVALWNAWQHHKMDIFLSAILLVCYASVT